MDILIRIQFGSSQDSIKQILNKILRIVSCPKYSHDSSTLLILNFKFKITTVTQIDLYRVTSSYSFTHAIETINYPILTQVCFKYHVKIQTVSRNSSITNRRGPMGQLYTLPKIREGGFGNYPHLWS